MDPRTCEAPSCEAPAEWELDCAPSFDPAVPVDHHHYLCDRHRRAMASGPTFVLETEHGLITGLTEHGQN